MPIPCSVCYKCLQYESERFRKCLIFPKFRVGVPLSGTPDMDRPLQKLHCRFFTYRKLNDKHKQLWLKVEVHTLGTWSVHTADRNDDPCTSSANGVVYVRVYLATAGRLSARSMTADIDSSHTDSTTAAMISRRCGLHICL